MRFSKLIEVDNYYKNYIAPDYDNSITLAAICENYRNFACSRMHLYYDIRTVRLFIAGMASTKLPFIGIWHFKNGQHFRKIILNSCDVHFVQQDKVNIIII